MNIVMRNVVVMMVWISLAACGGATPERNERPTAHVVPAAPTSSDSAPIEERAPIGSLSGRVVFNGAELLPMGVPKRRASAAHCRDEQILHNALVAAPGPDGCTDKCPMFTERPLSDVIVRLPNGVAPASTANAEAVGLHRKSCMSLPRALVLTVDQPFTIVNDDPILHSAVGLSLVTRKNVFNAAQPKGADPLAQTFSEGGLYRIGCDVHDWEVSFVWVSDHGHAAVTGADGRFTLKGIPKGTYKLEAWHAFLGLKTIEVTVATGRPQSEIAFEYDGSEFEPPENTGELDDLF